MIRNIFRPSKIAVNLACLALFAFTNPLSAAITIATGYQAAVAVPFTPTWTPAPNSLIAGLAPSGIGAGNFSEELAGRDPATLTQSGSLTIDKSVTSVYYLFATSKNYVTCGGAGGSSLTYTLPFNANGYDITNVTVFGGWADNGRDAQGYTVYYSTMAAPNTFIGLAAVGYSPQNGSYPTSTRVMITDYSGAAMATNVAQIKFDFTAPLEANGYQGYGQIGVFGTPSKPAAPVLPILPVLQPVTLANGDLIMTGFGGTPNYSYTVLTATNLNAPVGNWTVSTTGKTDGTGAFSVGIPTNATPKATFFRLRMP